jgi:small subunit ribosomal protein S19
LGEFAPTRTFRGHKGSVQKKVGKWVGLYWDL